jgi:N-acetylmuramoyl-L-alanine amidase
VTYDKQQFSEIQDIRLSPLTPDEPNTRMVIRLSNPSVEMDSHVSLDGRTMEVVLTPKSYTALNYARRLPKINIPDAESTWTAPVTKLRKGDFTVVVDAGHGGKDLGANRNNVYEKDLNLSVALKLKKALEARGVNVQMTRATDMFLELSQITAISNRIKPDAFISVHTNASLSPAANGLETYYYTPQSVPLAKAVHKHAVNNINSPDRGVRKAMFYVIHHTQIPAVLFEMGYISHPTEREALQSETRQNATAEALAQGVVEFLGRTLQAQAPEEGALP